ncbi:MAG: TIGR03621 family F420-dependent LLM class oxidoreductase, partial [Ilumatobacter sp.]
MQRPVRFGAQIRANGELDPIDAARRAEQAGFDVVLVPDHVGPGRSPIPVLSAIAAVTDRIRVGTFVLNADMRNPVQLAWEATTLDHLSRGRFELGLGAGHTPQEYARTGIERRPAAERKAALREYVRIVRGLLDGETVSFHGEYHRVEGAHVERSLQERLPILVGGNGRALLEHAGAHADIVGLQGLGRTLADGHSHEVRWTTDHLDAQIEEVRVGAAHRFDDVELNALVQVVAITDDRTSALRELSDEVDGVDIDELDASPYVLVGSVDEIADKILRCRERWGISYFAV